jgi:hypothetical protein
MFDQMSMPVLFVVVFVVLGIAAGALFVAIRTFGMRERSPGKDMPIPPKRPGVAPTPK